MLTTTIPTTSPVNKRQIHYLGSRVILAAVISGSRRGALSGRWHFFAFACVSVPLCNLSNRFAKLRQGRNYAKAVELAENVSPDLLPQLHAEWATDCLHRGEVKTQNEQHEAVN